MTFKYKGCFWPFVIRETTVIGRFHRFRRKINDAIVTFGAAPFARLRKMTRPLESNANLKTGLLFLQIARLIVSFFLF